MKKQKPHLEVIDRSPLKWPDGWPRTLINARQTRTAWKKSLTDYKQAVGDELARLGATAASITINPIEKTRLDPGVAIWFSLNKTEDFAWQNGLGLDNPAPTLEEIDGAFRRLIAKHHPDQIANGSGGDINMFKKLREHREQARAWVMGLVVQEYEHCIPCDTFSEVRWNLAGIRMALAYFRGLERIGIPAILDKVMSQAFKAPMLTGKESHAAAAT